MSSEPTLTGTPVECIVGRLEQDVYADIFDLLRSSQNRSDSIESHAKMLTKRIIAYTADLRQSVERYRDELERLQSVVCEEDFEIIESLLR